MTQFKDIEHRFDERFYFSVVKKRAEDYIYHAFEGPPIVEGLENLAQIPKETNCVYVASHKSHLDYILIPYALVFNAKEQPPAVAAGDNLFKKWGPLNFDKWIRKAKGYKIIRRPSDEKRREILMQLVGYTAHLLGTKENILLFPEKGRSYSGEMLEFDKGVFTALLSAAKRSERNIAFVPVTVSYECIPEDCSFPIFEKRRLNPTKWNTFKYYLFDWPVIYAHKFLNKPLGRAIVRFGKPHFHPDENGGYGNLAQFIAGIMRQRCGNLLEITPTAIFAHSCRGGTYEAALGDVEFSLEALIKNAKSMHLPGKFIYEKPIQETIYRALHFLDAPLHRVATIENDQVKIRRPDVIAYYSNTIAHYFTQSRAPRVTDNTTSHLETKAF